MDNLFKKNKNKDVFKIFAISCSVLLLVVILNFYVDYKYLSIVNNFYSKFNSCDFTEAKKIINNDSIYLKLKKKKLNNDLNAYFSEVVNNICQSLLESNEEKEKALIVFNEIKSYNILNSSINKLIISLDKNYVVQTESDYKAILLLGVDSYNNGNLKEGIDYLKKIPSTSKYANKANKYIKQYVNEYKEGLFNQADELVKDDYYTKAINLLKDADTSIIDVNYTDIEAKINSISEARENYLTSISSNENKQETISASSKLLQSLTSNNINTLNIESLTSNLIYVNLKDQITYIYKGSINNWDKIKSFKCSTGIESEKTPTGIFDVRERGAWFFSDKYNQGGKYWVQFYGDYLFHSVPYNKDQSEVVDYTLGVPASHGCIRLKTEDAKWIYDNIESGTKVIIN
ncbi:L,D-transpeptidase [uncultured Clostridium sp.]|uniref:L,D-transpeptidase n=1 Tax=uncultured Clostridium sp. TaxID=59620 RepID=UPI0025CF67E1|nr:L,D-transpeptidase [uncultured Clostridium sp.]